MKKLNWFAVVIQLLVLCSCNVQQNDVYHDEAFLSSKYFLNDCRDIGNANPWDGHWLANISDISYLEKFSTNSDVSFADFYVDIGEDGFAHGRGVISLADENQTVTFYEEFSYYCVMNGNAAAYIHFLTPTKTKLSIVNIYWLRIQIDYSFDDVSSQTTRLTFQFRFLRTNEHPQEFDQ